MFLLSGGSSLRSSPFTSKTPELSMIRIRNYRVERGGFLIDIPELILSGKKNFVIGKNGSGKTTLLQSFAGIIESSGVFEVNGRTLANYPLREGTSVTSRKTCSFSER